MIYRNAVSLNHIGRPLPPRAAHRADPNVFVHQGNHGVIGLQGRQVSDSQLEILHFPIRSKEQFENKIRKGGAAYARNLELPPNVGVTWRKLYNILILEGSLEVYLRGYRFTAEKLAAGLASGRMIIDTRLADFCSQECAGGIARKNTARDNDLQPLAPLVTAGLVAKDGL